MLIHLLTPGGLSWTRNGVPKTPIAQDRLKRAKANTNPADLCHGLPSEFEEFLRYCRRLSFAERPDYTQWIEAFRDLAAVHPDAVFPRAAPRRASGFDELQYAREMKRGARDRIGMMRADRHPPASSAVWCATCAGGRRPEQADHGSSVRPAALTLLPAAFLRGGGGAPGASRGRRR